MNLHVEWDIENTTYRQLKDLLVNISTHKAVTIDKSVYVMSNEYPYNFYQYAMDDNQLSKLPNPKYNNPNGCITHNTTHIFYLGGGTLDQQSITMKNTRSLQMYDISKYTWQVRSDITMNYYRHSFACEYSKLWNSIFVFGGVTLPSNSSINNQTTHDCRANALQSILNDIEIINLTTTTTTNGGGHGQSHMQLFQSSMLHSSVSVGDFVYVTGGLVPCCCNQTDVNHTLIASDFVQVFDLRHLNGSLFNARLNFNRYSHNMLYTVLHSSLVIFVFGGETPRFVEYSNPLFDNLITTTVLSSTQVSNQYYN
ncbi:hypothetical protein RFI_13214 [Reticulomyxa filosa]|uniref:Kelch repeat-containing protein n=1 Tax=Reticulomyxa filosa TaxID=46433 RepID=X6NCB9_RETFI|nr:hypothetical protein RFI_13214 [Reticulomyxa filosa]|eukprot:ETO23945.1 hypothetical protein RFI_13214 [Reticulomyxa filosa]